MRDRDNRELSVEATQVVLDVYHADLRELEARRRRAAAMHEPLDALNDSEQTLQRWRLH